MKKNYKEINYLNIINKIYYRLSIRRKFVIFIFFLFSIIGAFTEIASISIIIPFMDLMIDPEKIYFYLSKLNLKIPEDYLVSNYYLIIITLVFIFIIIISNLLKFLLGYLGQVISNNVTHEMNIMLFKSLLAAPSLSRQKGDENNVNSNIIKLHSVTVLLQQVLSIISNSIILLFIFFLLINIIDRYIFLTLIFFGFSYVLLAFIFKKILSRNSLLLSESIYQRATLLNNALGLFKIIKVNYLEKYFLGKFIKEDYRIAKAAIINSILITLPGILIITLAIISFSLLIFYLRTNDINLIDKIPVFSALVFSLQKIIPMMQNIYAANGKFRANYFQAYSALNLVSENKNLKFEKEKKIELKNKLIYQNINFKYENKKEYILKNLNIELSKGDRILIRGKSGVGKTTLINILLGIAIPKNGKVKIDNNLIYFKKFKQLRNLYSYIPQDIFIFKGTFNQNISIQFQNEKANYEKIKKVSKIARIYNFIKTTKKSFNTIVKHSARNISGGQMQRIGIARGLYKDSQIFIFDESTNAIDKVTENKILKNLLEYYPDRIFIFISHKELNRTFFNKRYILKNKKLNLVK